MKPPAQWRFSMGNLQPTDIAILIRMAFAPSHCDAGAKRRTIVQSGAIPFTNRLPKHPVVMYSTADGNVARTAATDAAMVAAGDGNVEAMGPVELRALAEEKRRRGMMAKSNSGHQRPRPQRGGGGGGHGRLQGTRLPRLRSGVGARLHRRL